MINDSSLYLIVLIGIIATEPWRWAGVFFSKGLDEDSEIIKWVRAVSTALIAALIMRLLLTPPGMLEATPISIRILSLIVATIIFFATGKKLVLSIGAGLVTFLVLLYLTKYINLTL